MVGARDPRSGEVQQNPQEVAGAPQEDKDVPDDMVIGHPLADVEGDTASVEKTADQEPPQQARGHGGYQGFGGHNNQPAHADVDGHGNPFVAAQKEEFIDDARRGDPPDDAEDGPPPHPAHADKGHGGVAAGDEDEDGEVVQAAEKTFDTLMLNGVVEGGGEIEEDEGGTVHDKAVETTRVVELHGAEDERRQSHGGENGAQPVGNAVKYLLDQGIGACRNHGLPIAQGNEKCHPLSAPAVSEIRVVY